MGGMRCRPCNGQRALDDAAEHDKAAMPKLSASLEALINAPSARPGPAPAPPGMRRVYEKIALDGVRKRLGTRPWLAASAAATMTLNSPDSLSILLEVASADREPTAAADFMREIGLKCISFNGVPRTINCLNAFRAALPPAVTARLSTTASRRGTPDDSEATNERGRRLFDSIYRPVTGRLLQKLERGHPGLPSHILDCHYGRLLADPPSPEQKEQERGGAGEEHGVPGRTGRFLTSVIAVACLRAQTGVGPQLVSHIYGLRKAYRDGSWRDDWTVEPGTDGKEDEAVKWLAGDEGNEWILTTVDSITEALRTADGAEQGKAGEGHADRPAAMPSRAQ